MESINFVKGYGKVNYNPVDDPTSQPHHKLAPVNHRRTVVISLLVFFTLVIAATVATLIYKTTTHKHHESTVIPTQSPSTNPVESLRTFCSVAQYPDSCISSLNNTSLLSKPDPELVFVLSLRVSVSELRNVSSLPKTLIPKSNDPQTESALRDCASLFDDALSQLNNSVALMVEVPGEKMLTEMKISDLNSWISAAMTDQDTCLDGLEEMGSAVLDEVKTKVQRSKEYMSNSLAILSKMDSLLNKFGMTMH